MFNHVAFNMFHDYSIAKLSLYYEVVHVKDRTPPNDSFVSYQSSFSTRVLEEIRGSNALLPVPCLGGRFDDDAVDCGFDADHTLDFGANLDGGRTFIFAGNVTRG